MLPSIGGKILGKSDPIVGTFLNTMGTVSILTSATWISVVLDNFSASL